MNREGPGEWSGAAASVEGLRELRLMALLGDVMDELGQVRAAEELGVDRKTLWRCRSTGTLTPRLADALERHLLLGGGSAAARQRERVEALERRVGEQADDLRGAIEAVMAGVGERMAEQADAMRLVERRLELVETELARRERGAPGVTQPQGGSRYVPPRLFPQLVTREAEEGEEHVYGDAMPVIVEWRRVHAEMMRLQKDGGAALRRAEVSERLFEVEVVLIQEHGLTLPPASYPWNASRRRDEVWNRRALRSLVHAQRNRALCRLWVRRVLTLGLWWE